MAAHHSIPELASNAVIGELHDKYERVVSFQPTSITLTTESREPTRKRAALRPWSCSRCTDGTCPHCRDIAKWNTRFEEHHGAEMRAYYSAMPQPRFGVTDPSEI